MKKFKELKCDECGNIFKPTGPAAKYCNKCTTGLYTTKIGFIRHMFYKLTLKVKYKRYIDIDFSYEWFKNFLLNSSTFNNLYNEWRESNNIMYRPTIDRIDRSIHYCKSNIQVLSYKDNTQKKDERYSICMEAANKASIQHSLKADKRFKDLDSLILPYTHRPLSTEKAQEIADIGSVSKSSVYYRRNKLRSIL